MKHIVSVITITALLSTLLSTTACGYLLHPERVGQKSGRIDPTIVLLDAAGLLIGILPGVVAFAVDVTTGAIYLAPGQKSAIDKHKNRLGAHLKLAPVEGQSIDRQRTAEQLSLLLGQPVDAGAIEYFKPQNTTATVLARSAPESYIL